MVIMINTLSNEDTHLTSVNLSERPEIKDAFNVAGLVQTVWFK